MKNTVEIYLNGIPILIEKREYTYLELIELIGNPQYQNYTVVSTSQDGKNLQYSRGDKIRMEEEMKINIDITING